MKFIRLLMCQTVGFLTQGRTFDVEENQANRLLDPYLGLAEKVNENFAVFGFGERLEIKGEPRAAISATEIFENKTSVLKNIEGVKKGKINSSEILNELD